MLVKWPIWSILTLTKSEIKCTLKHIPYFLPSYKKLFNNFCQFVPQIIAKAWQDLQKHGFIASGICPDNELVEISEIIDHPFMIGCQFHPEFGSRLDNPHPLFNAFMKAAIDNKRIGAQFKL